jgi:hypothetical protein
MGGGLRLLAILYLGRVVEIFSSYLVIGVNGARNRSNY